jgi:hypothetical protein
MCTLPCNKVIIRRGGIELNSNAQLLPVPRRNREPEEEPVRQERIAVAKAVAKARMQRVSEEKQRVREAAMELVRAALPNALAAAAAAAPPTGIRQIATSAAMLHRDCYQLAIVVPPKRPTAPLPEIDGPPKRSNAANPLPEPAAAMPPPKAIPFADGALKAKAAMPPPTLNPGVIAGVIAMAQAVEPPAAPLPARKGP